MNRWWSAIAVFFFSIAMAQAQGFEAFGNVGYGRTFRIEDNSPGDGIFWGFGVGFRPIPRIRIEGAVENLDVLSHPRDYVANVLQPRASLAYEFSTSNVRPFVMGGAGVARLREIQTLTFPTRVEIREERETAFAVNAGAGVAIHAGARLVFRPQLAVIPTIASRSNINLFHTSIQIAFAW